MRSRTDPTGCGRPAGESGPDAGDEACVGAPTAITLMTPGWARVGLDEAADIALGEDFAANAPDIGIDAAAAADVGSQIRAALERAAESGVRFAAVLARPSPDGAVVAGLTLAVVSPGESGVDRPAQTTVAHAAAPDRPQASGQLEAPSGLELVALPCGPAVRTEGSHETDLGGIRLDSLAVRYMVALPGTGAVVVLSFSTPSARCRGALRAEFAQIAESLRFEAPGGD